MGRTIIMIFFMMLRVKIIRLKSANVSGSYSKNNTGTVLGTIVKGVLTKPCGLLCGIK